MNKNHISYLLAAVAAGAWTQNAAFAQASAPPGATTTTTVTTTEIKTETKADAKADAKAGAKADAKAGNTPAPLPAITAAPGSAEEVAQLRALVEALTTRLQGIESAQKKTDETVAKNAPVVTSNSKLPVVISGLLQARIDAFGNQEGPGAQQFDSGRIRRAEVRLTAPQITSRISGTVMFDLAKRLSQNSSQAVSQNSTFFQELQLSYLLRKGRARTSGAPTSAGAGNIPAPPNNIYIDAGQFKIPVGYEGDLVSSGAIPTVERALMFAARDPFGGGFGDIRETGIQLRGTQGQFRYWAGVFNGLGERQNNDATSDTKALVGRLAYSPQSIQGLTVGLSGARGNNRNVGTSGGDAQRADRSLLNAFANYQRDKWTFRAEYLTGQSERQAINGDDFDNDLNSYYAHIGYYFTPKIEGVLRYDYLNLDSNQSDASVRDIVAGVNYYIKGNNAKIQLNVLRRNGGSGIVSGNGFSSSLANAFGNDRTELRLQGQVAF